MKIQTHTQHFQADSTLLSFVEKKMGKLNRFFGDITDANVLLKLEDNTGRIRDKITEVKMNLPGCVLFVRESSKTFEGAVDGAIFALSSQLSKYKYTIGKKRQEKE